MTYIATFFTHFAAVNFSRQLREAGQKPMLMPVPRKLSSSCRNLRQNFPGLGHPSSSSTPGVFVEDVDTVYLVQDDNYTPVYENHIR